MRASARPALWGDFPDKLQAATGAGVFVYSRAGYGASSPVTLPRPLDYMHVEALEVLPKLLDAIGFRRGRAARPFRRRLDRGDLCRRLQDHRVRGRGDDRAAFRGRGYFGASIAEIKQPMRPRDLKAKLARWHSDVDNAFYGWNGAWLDPKFRDWDISDYLAYIRVPVAILQGADDRYGTIRQIEIAAARVLLSGRCDDHSGRRAFAASGSAGSDARCDLGIRNRILHTLRLGRADAARGDYVPATIRAYGIERST